MARVMRNVLGGVALVLVLFALGWFLGMRTKFRPVIDFQRRANRRLVNPRQMRSAGTPGAYAGVVHHVGRVSGATYDTPVVPLPTDDGFVVVLVYGTRSDWVRNVLAAGRAAITFEGTTVEVDRPEVLDIGAAPIELTPSQRREMRAFGNTECLVLHRAA